MLLSSNGGEPITFFEITTVAAFLLFSQVPADIVLLEVGLGGRFDSTNVIDHPKATVITPVSMDHPEFLGKTIAEIAFEKAGILKRGAPAIVAAQTPEALPVIERAAARLGIEIQLGGQDYSAREEHGRLVYEDGKGLLDLPLPRLAGRHQHQNAASAIATLRELWPDFSHASIEQGMLQAEWPARLQKLPAGDLTDRAPWGSEVWLDGGHNEAGGRALSEAMADMEDHSSRPLILICGTLATKDTAAFLAAFKGLAQEVIAVPIPGEHAGRTSAEVAAAARAMGVAAAAVEGVGEAMDYLSARAWIAPPRILIAGSLYLAGAVLEANDTPVR